MFGKRSNRTFMGYVPQERAPYGMEAVTARAKENAMHREMIGAHGGSPTHAATRMVLEARRTRRALDAVK